jgi:hypothetical protein
MESSRWVDVFFRDAPTSQYAVLAANDANEMWKKEKKGR